MKKKQTVTILGSEQEIIDYTILPREMKKGSQLCFFETRRLRGLDAQFCGFFVTFDCVKGK